MSSNLPSSNTRSNTVGGMHCGHCSGSVSKVLRAVTGVVDVTVDIPTGLVEVTTDRPVPTSDLERAVVDAGFDVVDKVTVAATTA